MRHYQVRDVMTANPMTVTPATPLKNVADILVRARIGVVPVLTPQGRVAGVVAEGDLLRKEQLQRDPDGRHSRCTCPTGSAGTSPPPKPRGNSWTATRRPCRPARAWRRQPG